MLRGDKNKVGCDNTILRYYGIMVLNCITNTKQQNTRHHTTLDYTTLHYTTLHYTHYAKP